MPAPDPKQLRIMKKLEALLEGINPENTDPASGEPYEWDMRGKVYRGVSTITADRAEDTLSILEMPRQEIRNIVGEGVMSMDGWMLMLQGWPKDDPENPSDNAYRLKAAVEQRLSRIIAELRNGRGPAFPEFMLGEDSVGNRELASFTIVPGVVRPPEDTASRLAMFYMPIVLGVRMNVGDPFL